MKKYVLLITDQYDWSNRHWTIVDNPERAKRTAQEYEKHHKDVEIYEISTDLRYDI